MSTNPRIVNEDVTITWDGVPARFTRGQQVDVPPGSELEKAIGKQRLDPMFRRPAVTREPPSAPPVAADETAPVPRKTKSAAKDGDDKGDES